MPPLRPSTKPFAEALREALDFNNRTQQDLADELGLDRSFFSKAIRTSAGKRLRPDQMRDIARLLDLPEDYFRELREQWLLKAMTADPEFGLWLYQVARRRLRDS